MKIECPFCKCDYGLEEFSSCAVCGEKLCDYCIENCRCPNTKCQEYSGGKSMNGKKEFDDFFKNISIRNK